MTADALLAHYAFWIAAGLLLVWWLRRWATRPRPEREAVFARLEEDRRKLQGFVDGIDRRAAERAEASRRYVDRLIAESAALANDPNAGEESGDGTLPPARPGVVVWVTLPPGATPDDVSTVVQKFRAAAEDARTATGGRIPIEVHTPAT